MTTFRLQVRAFPRETLPADLGVGEHLTHVVRTAFAQGRHAPTVVVLRSMALEALDPRPASAAGLALPSLLAGLTTTTTAAGSTEAVGLAGQLMLRPPGGGPPVPVAGVFLEWADNRWWHWQALLDARGRVRLDTEQVRMAEAGDAMPLGLGRWWSAGRRHGLRLTLSTLSNPGDGGVVH